MNHKICITGSSGWLGSVLLKHFQDNKTLFKEDNNWFEAISKIDKINEFDIKDGQDLLNEKDAFQSLEDIDTLVHIAGVPSPRHGNDFEKYFDANVRGTLNITKQAIKQGVKRIVYASSTAYYGLDGNLPIEAPIKEDNKVVTQLTSELALDKKMELSVNGMAYGTSKVMAEQVLANYGMTGMIEVVILRIAPVGMPVPHKGLAHVTLKRVIQAFDIAISKEKVPSYSAYTIANDTDGVDMSKSNDFFDFNNLT